MSITSTRRTEQACRHLVEPLARVFLLLGIGVGEFTSICKAAYVSVAAEKARSKSGRVNRSRVAVITGLTRAEVTRLLAVGNNVPRQPWHRHRAARVLDGWFLDPAFKSRDGRPKDLPKNGGVGSFGSLVRKYGGDIPVRAVLEELLNSDAIEMRRNGMLRPRRRGIVGRALSNKEVAEIGLKTGRLLATLIHNLENPNERWFEASVTKAKVDATLVPYLRKTVAARGTALLDAFADQFQTPPSDIPDTTLARAPVAISVGMYLSLNPSKRKSSRNQSCS